MQFQALAARGFPAADRSGAQCARTAFVRCDQSRGPSRGFLCERLQSNYAASGLLRLRTAHAALDWRTTEAFIELDRSILEPNQPSSLVAIAQPELAWAGNLWNWSPADRRGPSVCTFWFFAHQRAGGADRYLRPADAGATSSPSPVSQTERSRWPGTEARVAFLHGVNGNGPEIGAAGYFSPHRTAAAILDAWAGAMDLRLPLTRYFEMTANAYRGQALAGLGGGGYVNYYYCFRRHN